MEQGKDIKTVSMTSGSAGKGREVKKDVFYYTDQMVNIVLIGKPGQGKWVLIDAGMPKSGSKIIEVAEERFGKGSRPEAILLTHGHFDHVGGVVELLNKWRVPIYAHPLEFPYLTGKLNYPEPDVPVEDGKLAKITSIYPHQPLDLSGALLPLSNAVVHDLPEWKCIHTPGHSPGHVSFFRERDRLLLSGDAFTTLLQDPFYKVLTQKTEVNGPPPYFTTDWIAAKESVQKLHALQPATVIPGHGSELGGEELGKGLDRLVNNFHPGLSENGRMLKRE